jgi:hypothetical protein
MTTENRRCKRCLKRLNLYNPGEYCHACEDVVRQPRGRARQPERDPTDPVQRLRKWLRSPEFDYVVKEYRRRCSIPPQGYPAPRPYADWTKPVAEAGWNMAMWLDIRLSNYDELTNLLLGIPLPDDFAEVSALPRLPFPRALIRDEAKLDTLEEELGQDIVAWEKRPRMQRRDLPLLILVKDMKGDRWRHRMEAWNSLFPHEPFDKPDSMEKAWRRASRRKEERENWGR